jgi:hypothetical protein
MNKTTACLGLLFVATALAAPKTELPVRKHARLQRALESAPAPVDWPVFVVKTFRKADGTDVQLAVAPDRLRDRSWGLGNAAYELRSVLTRHQLGTNWTLRQLKQIAPYMGVRLAPSYLALPVDTQRIGLARTLDTYSKLPWRMIQRLRDTGHGIDLVSHNVTNHPLMEQMRGVIPRGWAPRYVWNLTTGKQEWEEQKTWDDIVGAGAVGSLPSVIAADSLDERHGSADVILHEVGHAVDHFFADSDHHYEYSVSRPFADMVRGMPYERIYPEALIPYNRDYQEENFAEMFAKFFKSAESRAELAAAHPAAAEYYAVAFEGARPARRFRSESDRRSGRP